MKRVVILGGRGFMGSRIAEDMRGSDFEIKALGREDCDLWNIEALRVEAKSWDRMTRVVMCAGVTRNRDASDSAAEMNKGMCERLADALPVDGIAGLLFMSSAAVYEKSPPSELISEEMKPQSLEGYGASKLESERILRMASDRTRTPLLILRPSIVFGRGDRGRSLVGRWVRSLMDRKTIRVMGYGRAKIDLVAVEDLVTIVSAWAKNPFADILNLVGGQPLAVCDLIKQIGFLLNRPTVIQQDISLIDHERDWIFDLSRLRRRFPLLEPKNIPEAIQRYVTWASADPSFG